MNFKDEDERRAMEAALDSAIEKWLDKQFTTFGKWSFRGILAVIIGGALWLYFHTGGLKS